MSDETDEIEVSRTAVLLEMGRLLGRFALTVAKFGIAVAVVMATGRLVTPILIRAGLDHLDTSPAWDAYLATGLVTVIVALMIFLLLVELWTEGERRAKDRAAKD